MLSGRMSWRRFQIVLENLPSESAFRTAVLNATDLNTLPPPEPGVYGPWAHSEYLLAGIFDRIGDLIYMQSDKQQPPPERYPRPGVRLAQVTAINAESMAYLEYLRQHQGEAPPDDWRPEVG